MRYPAGLEVVKWLAVLAMIADHVDLVLFGRSVPWLFEVGRFSYPAFALTFGIGLAFTARPLDVAARLLLPALLAQVAWAFIDPAHPANVLVLFTAAALTVHALQLVPLAGVVCFAWMLAAHGHVEGGLGGVMLVAAGWLGVKLQQRAPAVLAVHIVAAAPWLLFAPSAGIVAGLGAPHLARWLPVVPRASKMLPWIYAAHLWVLLILKAAY